MKSQLSTSNFAVLTCLIVLMQFCCPDLWARSGRQMPARPKGLKNAGPSATTYNSAESTRPRNPKDRRQRTRSRNFAEVDILLDDQFTVADISRLQTAPGSNVEILDNPSRVKAQIPSSQFQTIYDKGALILARNDFILVEGYADEASVAEKDAQAKAACSGTYQYGANNSNVTIPDPDPIYGAEWVYSAICISTAPPGAMVTCIDVHYEIIHTYRGDLDVDLTDENGGCEFNLWIGEAGDSANNINETETGITVCNGEAVNQCWLLWAIDWWTQDTGYIDSWWIKVYYGGDPPGGGYCDTSTWYEFGEYISRVRVGDIDNTSGHTSYSDYTAYSTQMQLGQSYNILVTNGEPFATDVCGIWVDWNQDEDFNDAGETISVSGNPGYGPYEATITPPGSALAGETRMRIRIVDPGQGDTLSPCGPAWYGEVEDYTIEVGGGGGGGYCDASTLDTTYEYIARVQVGDIDRTSGSNGYADYTHLSTQMQLGQSYNITVTGDQSWPTDVCGIWVDWNQDSDFTDAGEAISVSGSPGLGPYTASITPPGSALAGETRMRVRIVDSIYDPILSPCDPAWYGEVEDYTIEVIDYQYLPGGITGSKFNDLDGDGTWDGGEDGIQGWEIYLDLNSSGQYETSEPNVITGLDGFYEFTDLPPDTYSVAEMARAGWQQTFPGGDGTHTIVVEPNEVVENVNFGNIETDAGVISIQAIEDTYASSGNPDTSYGSNENFCSGKISDSVCRTYLKFDLSSIPVGKTIVSARLRLNSGFVSYPYPQIGARYLVNDNWDEMTLTWNNAPTEFSPVAADTVTISIGDNFWTLTDDVEAAYWDDGIYSVVFVSADEALAVGACFSSEEVIDPEQRPYLEIEFGGIIKYGGGTGSAEDPYQIWTHEQMNEIGLNTEDWDKHFILMADIDLSEYTGTQFNIIGNSTTPFTGGFDGNGNTISNFSYGPTASANVGLFGSVEGLDTTIENLDLSGVSINTTGNRVGAIVARLANGASLTNCSVRNGLIDASNDVGGLVGENNSGTIQWCEFEGIIDAGSTVGGLVGENVFDGIISNCSSKGTVIGFAAVGGLVGENSFDSLISMCYSLCDVQRQSVYHMYFGGLVGANSQGTIANCYAHGSVTGGSYTGGACGSKRQHYQKLLCNRSGHWNHGCWRFDWKFNRFNLKLLLGYRYHRPI